jgi:hypothetical protein
LRVAVFRVSGKPYEIRFSDSHTLPAAAFFQQKLWEFDQLNGRID